MRVHRTGAYALFENGFRTLNRGSFNVSNLLFAFLAIVSCVIFSGCNKSTPIGPPSVRFVMASVPLQNNVPPESRVTIDGVGWTSPGLATGPAMSGTPPGLAHRNLGRGQDYVLAWFDPSGTLHTNTSAGGLVWSGDMTHGTFPVDQLSRPMLAHGTANDNFVAAFRQSDGSVAIEQLIPPGPPSTVLQGVRADMPPALVYWNQKFYLYYISTSANGPGPLMVLSSTGGIAWPSGPGLPLLSGGSVLRTAESATYVDASAGTLTLAVPATPPSTTGLSTGNIQLFSSSDGVNWNLRKTLTRVTPHMRGASVTGPITGELVTGAPGGRTGTDTYMISDGETSPIDVIQRTVQVPTGTQLEVSLTFGPAGDGIRHVSLTFTSFHRLQPGGSGTEDVTLSVEHHNAAGVLVSAMPPFTLHQATKDAGHLFREGGGTDPSFSAVLRAGESIFIQMAGANGTSSVTLPASVLLPTSNGLTHTQVPPPGVGYELKYIGGLQVQ